MVTYMLCVRRVVYLKGLGEPYITLGRRLLLLLHLMLLLRLMKTKTEHAGNFKIVGIYNAEKTQRRKFFVVEIHTARRTIHEF